MKKRIVYVLLGIIFLVWLGMHLHHPSHAPVEAPLQLPVYVLKAQDFTYTKSFIGTR